MFKGLEHTAIASPNPENLAKWYVAHLEFVINFQYDGNFFVKSPHGGMLEIIPCVGDSIPSKMRDQGIRHLAITVDDFDAAQKHLEANGVQMEGEAFVNQGNRLVFFRDLDGNLIHLIKREKPLP
jgi:glyoxylase I family protein